MMEFFLHDEHSLKLIQKSDYHIMQITGGGGKKVFSQAPGQLQDIHYLAKGMWTPKTIHTHVIVEH